MDTTLYFDCIDGHTCGNPVRLITSGHPELNGNTQFERRQDFIERFDWIRTGLMFEPRGHAQMSGAFLYPSTRPDCDIAVLYIETSGCLPMCGHGTIGTVTMAIEHGLVQARIPGTLALDTPAGKVMAYYTMDPDRLGKVKSVRLTNVPSFLIATDVKIHVAALGDITADIAYGGNFYPIIEPQTNFLGIEHYSASQLVDMGKEVRNYLNDHYEFTHPDNPDIKGIRHCQWTGRPKHPNSNGANAVLYGESAIDRSPCGTGTSARLAQRYAKGLLKQDESFIHESIIGSQFIGRVEHETTLSNGHPAIIPSIEGWAVTTGYNKIMLNHDDPYRLGFEVK